MVAIAFRFSSGRFHATVWGRHVNEGVPEWPPSPWRILRALVAVWKRCTPEVPEERICAVLAKLASPPYFHLPPAAHTHTRHFMPWFKKGPGDRTLVFDTFLGLERGARVVAVWPGADLDERDRETLAGLLGGLSYLGRAESWCEASVEEGWSEGPRRPHWIDARTGEVLEAECAPLADGQEPPAGYEAVRVLVPDGFDPWRPLDLASRNPNLLCVETTRLRKGLMDPARPPGSRWVRYARPHRALAVEPVPRARWRALGRPRVARFAVDSPVLPPVTETLRIAELARRAAMSRYGGPDKRKSAILSGRDETTRRLEGHSHAHYLPTDEDGDGRLDHLTLYAPAGLDADHRAVLGGLRVLNPGGGRPELRLLLLGFGEPGEFEAPILGTATGWRSATPFMLVRHPKRNGSDSPDMQLRLELRRRGLPEPVFVEKLQACPVGGRTLRWLAFRRYRTRGPDPPLGLGFGFRIEFPHPVRGPIAVGYAAHFGLGQFVPAGPPGP